MKQTTILKLLLAVQVLLFSTMCVDASAKPSGDEIDILIGHKPTELPGGPRSSSPAIIDAFYDTDYCYICACLSNAGTLVEVEIVNSSTNESYTNQISGSGSSYMPISGTSGYWTITFTLESGDVYIGEFVI
jgi:hypothetical protein